MRGKVVIFITSLFMIMTIMIGTALADSGPKPYVVVNIKGMSQESRYYVTLLSDRPQCACYINVDQENAEKDIGQNYNAWRAFNDYKDEDGYYFLQFYDECSKTSRFSWDYFPPNKFKILIYDLERNKIFTDGKIYERYAFDSHYTATVSDEGTVSVSRNLFHSNEVISTIGRVATTLVIELIIALLFGFRKKYQIVFIVIVNIITQTILNVMLNSLKFYIYGGFLERGYLTLEFGIFVLEAVAYTCYFVLIKKDDSIKKWKPTVYALTANIVSFVAGALMA